MFDLLRMSNVASMSLRASISLRTRSRPAPAEFVADVVGEAVDRADVGRTTGEPLHRAPLHLIRRLDVEGQGGHRFGCRPRVDHQVSQPFGQDSRLSRTRRCDDARRTGAVAHGEQLIRRQVRRHDVMSNRLRIPDLGVPAMNDDAAVGQFGRVGRTPVDVGIRPVSEDDVSPAADHRALMGQRASSFDRMPPDEAPRPGVVVVRPEEELQALDGKLEIRCQAVDRPGVTLVDSKPVRIEPQLDDQRPPTEPGRVQACDDIVWLCQFGFAEGHPFQSGPGCWQVTALQDHGPAAERGWPEDHRANLAARCDDPWGPGEVRGVTTEKCLGHPARPS